MGVSAQQLLQSDPEYLQRQLAQQEMQRLNPTGSAAGAIGALLGRGVSNVAGGRGFFDVNDAGLRRVADVQKIMSSTQFNPENPVKYYEELATSLQQAGYGDLAPMAFQEASKFRKERKFTTVAPGATVLNEKGEVVYEAPSAEKMVKTPPDFAAAGKELGFGVRANIGEYSQQETTAINNLLESRGIRRAEAGVPRSGEVKVPDIKGAQDIVATYTKTPQDRLAAVQQIRVSLSETKQGTGAALPQLRRDLVKLVGDNQIGQGEVKQALGSVGIVGDAISGINQLFTGVPSQTKLKDVEKFIDSLEQAHAKSYNRGREQAGTLLKEARLPEDTRTALLPPAYKTAAEKKASKQGGKFTEGKIYVDANGNRARYVNGNFVSVE
jgi:hypothetical protein